MIIIGLGTGRSGTLSLTELLDAQPDSVCFHELNPSCTRFFGTPRPALNMIDEFGAILDGGDPSLLTVDLTRSAVAASYDRLAKSTRVELIGDVSFYHLSYVELMAGRRSDVRFICLKRDRDATVKSWLGKSEIGRWPSKYIADRLSSLIVRDRFYRSKNFWMEHDGTLWRHDPVWDKCFPKFKTDSKREAVAAYWDYYYEEVDRLGAVLGDRFMMVATEDLSDRQVQRRILNFCSVAPENHVFLKAHSHKAAKRNYRSMLRHGGDRDAKI